jgi:protein SCO1/2
MGTQRTRIVALAVGLALAVGALVVVVTRGHRHAPLELRGAAIEGTPVAPAIRLADARGRTVTLAGGDGVTLVTFLYTHCPDVCPLIASRLNAALARLGTGARVLAVSVDPKGDTPAAVARYARVRHLRPAFRYLVGSRAQLAPIWKAYYVGQQQAQVVIHAAETVLVDRAGRERVRYDASATPADIAHDVRALGL